jgi:signal transduction histidine kinase/ActR/RegA family two-component response regulator
MKKTDLRESSFRYQWSFYERTISNYSILVKMFQFIEDGQSLVAHLPKVFVEETVFDMCQITLKDDREVRSGFFSLDNGLSAIDMEAIDRLGDTLVGPRVLHERFGYGTVFIYPLAHNIDSFGYLVLGKKQGMRLDTNLQRELELLGEVLTKSVQLSVFIANLRQDEEVRLKALDSRLGMTNKLLENVIDQFPHALLLVDEEGEVCFANENARKELGEAGRLLIGESLQKVIPGMEKEFFEKDRILKGEIEYRSGEAYKLFKLEGYPVKDGIGNVIWKSIALKDVVDEKLSEEENLHKGKMESIGRLAGGIAHDFNNLLTGVLGYASLMKRLTSNEQQLYRYAEVIEGAAKRAAVLTQHLLNFSRRQRRLTGAVDVNSLLDDVLFLLKESFRDVQIVKSFDDSLPLIKGDEAELQHAFLNLCINSSESMPEGGTLQVATSMRNYFGERQFAVIEIRDAGCGMNEEIKKRIFEPYFSTKTNNSKLGMGLYLVDKVVRRHGGFIELESKSGQGTCFSIYIPTKQAEQEAMEQPLSELLPMPSTGTRILLVDDEGMIRQLMAGVLEGQGFSVVQAEDGKSAIKAFSENPVDLVILDMIMPGMKGEEVLKALRTISPGVRVIVSSGFMSEEQRDRLKEFGIEDFLDKPYREEDVLLSVRRILSKSGALSTPPLHNAKSAANPNPALQPRH